MQGQRPANCSSFCCLANQDSWAAFSTSDVPSVQLCLVLGRARRVMQARRMHEGMPLLIAQELRVLHDQ